MNKKFVYQVGNNKKVILRCTANQISTVCRDNANVSILGRTAHKVAIRL